MKAIHPYDFGNGVSHPLHGEGYILYTAGRSDTRYGVQFGDKVEWLEHDELSPCPKAAKTRQSNRKLRMNSAYEAAQAAKKTNKMSRTIKK